MMDFSPAAGPLAGDAERFVLRALRHWVTSPAGRGEVWREFSRRFAPDHTAAMRAFERCLAGIAARTSRRFRHHPPCGAQGVTADEAALLRFLAAVQRGDKAGAIWHGADFLDADGAEAAAMEARAFADALLAGGLRLAGDAAGEANDALAALSAAVCPLA